MSTGRAGRATVAMLAFGLLTMVGSEAATLARVEPFYSWNTPICWTGFIVFADAVVFNARGRSWLRTSPREFALMATASIPLWLVFEAYNLRIRNWYYVGLPENAVARYAGFAWAFATIWPAIFEAAELVAVVRHQPAPVAPALTVRPASPALRALTAVGAAMLISPFLVSSSAATYLAAPVWLGFIFLLDPVNARYGEESVLADWQAGRTDRLINLLAGGLLCGGLWEFWNYWSGTKWIYTVPFLSSVKIFEMPVPGYFGFPPFAVECFAMYASARLLYSAMARRTTVEVRRPIAL